MQHPKIGTSLRTRQRMRRFILSTSLLLTAPPVLAAVPAADVNPLALTSEMRDFADQRVNRRHPRQMRLHELQKALFDDEKGLGVKYGLSGTYTAAGTFDARRGNCLSFTLLFVALARHVGLDTHFVEVDEVTGWSQRGEVGLSHWHMYVEVETSKGPVSVDFLPWSERRYRSSRRISESRVRAHYYNNVGAELLTAGDANRALSHFDKALELDATFNPARINKAVAHRRLGDADSAESGLLAVLADESRNAVAAANLAGLYLAEGRKTDAQKWLARRNSFLSRNPFHHFRLGMRAFQADQFQEARGHFKRAINRQPDEATFFLHLADTHLALGFERKARSNLRRALQLTDDPVRRQLLEARLANDELSPTGSS